MASVRSGTGLHRLGTRADAHHPQGVLPAVCSLYRSHRTPGLDWASTRSPWSKSLQKAAAARVRIRSARDLFSVSRYGPRTGRRPPAEIDRRSWPIEEHRLRRKNLPSFGTSMICTLSESLSATVYWTRRGLPLSAALGVASVPPGPARSREYDSPRRRREGSGAAVRLCCRSPSPAPFASAFSMVVSFRASASSRDCSICFCFSGSVYCMASDSPWP